MARPARGGASRRRVPSLPVYAVIWEDAAYDDTARPEPTVAVTCGVVLVTSEREILVASEVFDDRSSRHYTSIPRAIVRRIERVGRVRLPEFARPSAAAVPPVPLEEESPSEEEEAATPDDVAPDDRGE